MKSLLLLCVLLLMVPAIAIGQDSANETQAGVGVPSSMLPLLKVIGVPPQQMHHVYGLLEKVCKGKVHTEVDEPHNVYAIAANECYVVRGRVVQQTSKHQSLIVQQKLMQDENGIYFIGSFDNYSGIFENGQHQQVDYSLAPGAFIYGVGVAQKPVSYNAVDGTTMTVADFAILLYTDLSHQ